MKPNPQSLGFVLSMFMLSLAVVIWSDMFLFSKTVYFPEWTKILPSPIDAPKFITFLCLISVVFSAKTLVKATTSTSKVILLAPLAALPKYVLNTAVLDIHLLLNLVFHYLWMIGFHCLLPALALLGLRTIWQWLSLGSIGTS
jgi:hypothetical protein